MGVTGALWRRFEDMWAVQHPPPMAQLVAAVPEPDPPPPALLVPRPSLVEPITPVNHTCEPLTDSTGTTRGRCPACRAWRELANEDP